MTERERDRHLFWRTERCGMSRALVSCVFFDVSLVIVLCFFFSRALKKKVPYSFLQNSAEIPRATHCHLIAVTRIFLPTNSHFDNDVVMCHSASANTHLQYSRGSAWKFLRSTMVFDGCSERTLLVKTMMRVGNAHYTLVLGKRSANHHCQNPLRQPSTRAQNAHRYVNTFYRRCRLRARHRRQLPSQDPSWISSELPFSSVG